MASLASAKLASTSSLVRVRRARGAGASGETAAAAPGAASVEAAGGTPVVASAASSVVASSVASVVLIEVSCGLVWLAPRSDQVGEKPRL